MNINIIDILFLPAVFLIGIVTSIEDIRINKIRNKWIMFGLIYGILVFLGLFIWNLIADPATQAYYTYIAQIGLDDPRPVFRVHYDIFWKAGLNGLFSLLLGFLFWKFSALSAGDSKLFFIYAFLIPTKYYWRSYLPYFPALALFVNMFVIVLLYFIIRSSVYSIKKFIKWRGNLYKSRGRGQKKTKEKNQKNWKKGIIEKIKVIAGFTTIFLIFYYIKSPVLKHLGIDLGSFQQVFFVIIIIFSRRIMKIYIKNNKVFAVIALAGAAICGYGLITDPGTMLRVIARTLRIMVIFMFVMGILSKVVGAYVDRTSSFLIPITKLRPRMVIENIFFRNIIRRDEKLFDHNFGKVLPGGLNASQVRTVKEWADKKGIKEILILKKFPFAAWMFGAVIITLITKSSLINVVLEIIR